MELPPFEQASAKGAKLDRLAYLTARLETVVETLRKEYPNVVHTRPIAGVWLKPQNRDKTEPPPPSERKGGDHLMVLMHECCGAPVQFEGAHPFVCFGPAEIESGGKMIDYPVHIDERMAPVITALWAADIKTGFCCQGGGSDVTTAYIALAAGPPDADVRDAALAVIRNHLPEPDDVRYTPPEHPYGCWRFGWDCPI